jgi:triphosphoribosyl-dephospho-CoA synthetase
MNTEKYSLSFVGGALFHQESVRLAGLYLREGHWNEVRDEVIARNLLQARTTSSAKRICREICSRLKRLNRDELELLVEGDHQEQAYLLWIAVCRHHRFIYEFSAEVIRERFLTLRYDLGYEDFDAFFNAKMEWHEELEKVATTTRNKLRQVLFRMLREAEILNSDNSIIPATLSPRLINVLCGHASQDLYLFPVMETTLQECAK